MDEIEKLAPTLMPILRRVIPKLMAADILGVQPMSLPTGLVFNINNRMGQPYYITKQWELAGKHWYLLELTDQVKTWLTETFTETVDYTPFEIFEGQEGTVVTEETYTLLKLRWA